MDYRIRLERPADAAAVHRLNGAAFPGTAEADLVDALRRQAAPYLAQVATDPRGEIIGQITFSPAQLPALPALSLMGLAPMAVAPGRQGCGVGSSLVESGIEACRARGVEALIVLGHPGYYPRFGFVPASRFGFRCRWEVPDEAFMAQALVPGALAGASGVALYHPAFDGL